MELHGIPTDALGGFGILDGDPVDLLETDGDCWGLSEPKPADEVSIWLVDSAGNFLCLLQLDGVFADVLWHFGTLEGDHVDL